MVRGWPIPSRDVSRRSATHEAAKRRHIHSLGREPLKNGRLPFSQAAKRRQIHSLGREPQEEKRSIQSSPERATDLRVCLSPLRG